MINNVRVFGKVLDSYCDDLSKAGDEGQAVVAVIRALQTAIATGKSAELAQLVTPWMNGELVAALQAMELDDRAREDAITQLGAEVAK